MSDKACGAAVAEARRLEAINGSLGNIICPSPLIVLARYVLAADAALAATEEALRPLAAIMHGWGEGIKDETLINESAGLTIGDLRRAADAVRLTAEARGK